MDRMLALVRASGCLSVSAAPTQAVLNVVTTQHVPPAAIPGEPHNPPVQAKTKPAVQA